PQTQAGQRRQHGLAAGQSADLSVEVQAAESEAVEDDTGAGVNVPRIAERVEVPRICIPRLYRSERVEIYADAEQCGDRQRGAEREILREVGDVTGPGDRPGCRRQLADDHTEQRRSIPRSRR